MTPASNKLAWTLGAIGVLVLVALFSILSQPNGDPVSTSTAASRTVELATDVPATALIPGDWAYVSHRGQNASLGLAASPSSDLVEGVVDDNHVTGLAGRDDLRLDDVYVEVWASYQPFTGGSDVPALAPPLDPADFEAGANKFGQPIYEFSATPEEGGLYTFRYWSGPEASEEDKDEMLAIIRSLRFDR